jgi:hypothetical protein
MRFPVQAQFELFYFPFGLLAIKFPESAGGVPNAQ